MFKFPLNKCNECPIAPPHFGKGYQGDIETADIVIFGEAPGATEEKTGLPFQGRAGQLLRSYLQKYDFPFDRAIISNAALCRPPDNKTPNKKIIKACYDNIDHLLGTVQPKFVIVLGNTPLHRITKKSGITKLRGSKIQMNGATVMVCFHPAYLLRNQSEDLKKIFEEDIKSFCDEINGKQVEVKDERDYYIVSTIDEFNEMISNIYKTSQCAIDVETTGLRHWRNHIRSIQFSPESKKAYYLPLLEHKENIEHHENYETIKDIIEVKGVPGLEERDTTLIPFWNPEQLKYIKDEIEKLMLSEVVKTGQNFKFDRKFIEYWLWKHDVNKSIKNVIFDTMTASYLLDENSPNDLKTNAYAHFNDLRNYATEIKKHLSNKDEEENDFTKIKIDSLAPYGCGDTDATIRLTELFAKKLDEINYDHWMYEFYMPWQTIYTKAERIGVGLDIEQHSKTTELYEKEALELESNICKVAGKPDNQETREKIAKENPDKTLKQIEAKWKKQIFNLNSPKQLATVLYDEMKLPIIEYTETGSPSTKAEVMKELALKYPFCYKIVRYRNKQKMLSTYLGGMLKYGNEKGTIVPGFPTVHFNFNQVGAVTGRLSAKSIAINTMPRLTEIRQCICAFPDYYLVEFDLSQIELRLAAWYSQDPTMLYEFKNNIDIHRGTMMFMLNMNDEDADKLKMDDPALFKKQRKRAKLYNFGGLYRGSAKTLCHHLIEKLEEEELTDKPTIEDAQRHLDFFFNKYKYLAYYYDKVCELAEKNKQVISCFGRIRRLPALNLQDNKENRAVREEAFRQAINCVDEKTECLTNRGWKKYHEIIETDLILTKNIETNILEWNKLDNLNIYNYQGPMYLFENGTDKKPKTISALTTPNHRWLIKNGTHLYNKNGFLTSEKIFKEKVKSIHLSGEYPGSLCSKISDEFVEFIGWILTDGSLSYYNKPEKPRHGKPWRASICQSIKSNPKKVKEIQRVIDFLKLKHRKRQIEGTIYWSFYIDTAERLHDTIPCKQLSMNFLLSLTKKQLDFLLKTIQMGDGIKITTASENHRDYFQILAILTGKACNIQLKDKDVGRKNYSDKLTKGQRFIEKKKPSYHIRVLKRKYAHTKSTKSQNHFKVINNFNGIVWCPTVKNQSFVCRRESEGYYYQYITGNSPIQGTGSDIIHFAGLEIQDWLEKYNKKSFISFTVHDAIFSMVHKDEVYDYCKITKECMGRERPPITRDSIEIKSEGSIFKNWSKSIDDEEMQKLGITKDMLE